MAFGERSTEESDGASILVEDGTEPHAGGVAVPHEQFIKVRHLEDGPGGQGMLGRLEGLLSLRVPGECISAQETRQGCSDEAVPLDELPEVARQA